MPPWSTPQMTLGRWGRRVAAGRPSKAVRLPLNSRPKSSRLGCTGCESQVTTSSGPAAGGVAVADRVHLQQPHYPGTQAVANQLLHLQAQGRLMENNLRSQSVDARIPLILVHENSLPKWNKYLHLRLLYSANRVAVLLCRKVVGRNSRPDVTQPLAELAAMLTFCA